MEALANPIVIGLLIGLPASTLGLLGYRRSQKADKVAEASGAIAGWDKLIENLQEDNAVLRTERDELRRRIVALGGMVCIVAFIALGVESVKQDQERLVTRAARVARAEVVHDAVEQDGTIEAAVQAEVTEQVDDALATTTTSLPISSVVVPPTTTTTTTTSTTQPLLPAVTTTTVTIPITLPTIPEVTIP